MCVPGAEQTDVHEVVRLGRGCGRRGQRLAHRAETLPPAEARAQLPEEQRPPSTPARDLYSVSIIVLTQSPERYRINELPQQYAVAAVIVVV